MSKQLPYSVLNTYHPNYNELETKKLQLLYEGGDCIEKNAHLFIHRETMETSEIAYSNRLKCVSYRNYFAKIVNDYVADLFSKSFAVIPSSDSSDESTPGDGIGVEGDKFWRDFASNTDLQRHNLVNILSSVLTEGLTCGRAYIGVDFPKVNIVPQSRAEENELGVARAYTICIPTMSVIDWDIDEFGKYRYVVLKNETTPRRSFADRRDKKVTQFKIWEKDELGIVKFSVYEIVTKLDKDPKRDDVCVLVDEGTVSFKDIPVLCLEVPTQLWIGGLIGNLCAEHFRRSSSLVHAMNKNLFSIPFYQQGAELPASGDLNTMNQNVHRGNQTASQMRLRGFAVGSTDDKISFIEPSGAAYEIINQQLKELVDAIHAVVNQMGSTVSAHSVSLSRSGTSKMMDNHSKELVLSAYASLIKEFAVALYTLVSEGRNENIIWSTQGMNDFKIIDRDSLIAEATQINMIRAIAPSRTWYKHNALRLINELEPNLSPAEQKTIQDEVEAYYDKMSDEELLPKPPMEKPEEPKDKKDLAPKDIKSDPKSKEVKNGK